MVLDILVVGDLLGVHQVEEGGPAHAELDDWSEAAVLGKDVLVVPAPVGPAHGPAVGNGVVELAAEKPGGQLVHFHLVDRRLARKAPSRPRRLT